LLSWDILRSVETMFIRQTRRSVQGRTYTNYLLVESVRTPKGPRQKVVCSLGDLSPRPRQDWLKLAHKIAAALVGQDDLLEAGDAEVAQGVAKARAHRHRSRAAAIAIDPAGVCSEAHREAGPVHVGLQIWRRLGLDAILSERKLPPKTCRLACAMVLNRLIHPAAELAMPDWMRRTALADLIALDFDALTEDALYRVMDRLHPHRAAIEAALVARERSLFGLSPTLHFYDLTSTYFEGLAEKNDKAKRGYSRDHRPDCKQVVLGLAIGREGFPVAHEIFAGNTQDRATLATMLDRLAERVGLPEGATVVIDRGMAFDENLAELKQRKLHYVVAARQSERDRWLAEYEEEGGFEEVLRTPSPNNPAQKKTRVEVKLARHESETHVLCRSEGRIEKDRAIRLKHEAWLLADLAKLRIRIETGKLKKPIKIGEAIGRLKERYPRVARYYDFTYDAATKTLCVSRNDERHACAERRDGCYLLKTSRSDLSAEEAWRLYALLTRAEDAFRDMKSPLGTRPIFHQIERRVETHIFLCLLAYHLLCAIEHLIQAHGQHTSWASIRDTLRTHHICTVVLPIGAGQELRIRKPATPESHHRQIYRWLGIPAHICNPVYTTNSIQTQ
jgi:transposase